MQPPCSCSSTICAPALEHHQCACPTSLQGTQPPCSCLSAISAPALPGVGSLGAAGRPPPKRKGGVAAAGVAAGGYWGRPSGAKPQRCAPSLQGLGLTCRGRASPSRGRPGSHTRHKQRNARVAHMAQAEGGPGRTWQKPPMLGQQALQGVLWGTRR